MEQFADLTLFGVRSGSPCVSH